MVHNPAHCGYWSLNIDPKLQFDRSIIWASNMGLKINCGSSVPGDMGGASDVAVVLAWAVAADMEMMLLACCGATRKSHLTVQA